MPRRKKPDVPVKNHNSNASSRVSSVALEAGAWPAHIINALKPLTARHRVIMRVKDALRKHTARYYHPELSAIADKLDHMERDLEKEIAALVRELPVWTLWAKNIKGVGELSMGYIIAEVKDPRRFKTPSALIRFAGLDPTVKRRYGERSPYNQKLKWRMYILAESLWRRKAGYYRCLYDKYTQRIANRAENPVRGWKKRHMYGLQYIGKRFLIDLWTVAFKIAGSEPPRKPYVIDVLKHTAYEPPHIDKGVGTRSVAERYVKGKTNVRP